MRVAHTALLRPITIDAAIAGAFGAATLAGALVEDIDPAAGVVRRLDALGVLLIVGMTLPLVARRLLPRAVAIVTVGCVVAGSSADIRSASGRSRRSSRSGRWPTPPRAATPSWSGSPLVPRSLPVSSRPPAR